MQACVVRVVGMTMWPGHSGKWRCDRCVRHSRKLNNDDEKHVAPCTHMAHTRTRWRDGHDAPRVDLVVFGKLFCCLFSSQAVIDQQREGAGVASNL